MFFRPTRASSCHHNSTVVLVVVCRGSPSAYPVDFFECLRVGRILGMVIGACRDLAEASVPISRQTAVSSVFARKRA